MTLHSLAQTWLTEAALLDGYGASEAASAARRHAHELTEAIRTEESEELSISEAAVASGFSARRLRELLADGSIPNAGRWTCTIFDSVTKPTLQGTATIVCNQLGKAPISPPPANNLNLANILVQPMPDEYSVMRPNNGNGNVVQIINKACKLTDTQGNPIASLAGAATCTDADITMRYLEGDVVPDCIVDTLDTQASAFRWGSQKGTLLFNEFFNLEPSKPQKDDDIDVNDLQFVYGRFGSTCANPHPKQNPVNPKAA